MTSPYSNDNKPPLPPLPAGKAFARNFVSVFPLYVVAVVVALMNGWSLGGMANALMILSVPIGVLVCGALGHWAGMGPRRFY